MEQRLPAHEDHGRHGPAPPARPPRLGRGHHVPAAAADGQPARRPSLRVSITQLPKVLGTEPTSPDTFTQEDVETADPAWFVLLLDAQGDVLADNWSGDSADHPRVFGLDLARASQVNGGSS
ncbi:hypothetical protein [Clavibacter zhangzhiyongii]|uniref:hypothetical protein n=1 Tax=Clavibacter zhangzhiyongii TaxID=2768071 RepID=UPI0039E1A67A